MRRWPVVLTALAVFFAGRSLRRRRERNLRERRAYGA
jgi:hypothetical protein